MAGVIVESREFFGFGRLQAPGHSPLRPGHVLSTGMWYDAGGYRIQPAGGDIEIDRRLIGNTPSDPPYALRPRDP